MFGLVCVWDAFGMCLGCVWFEMCLGCVWDAFGMCLGCVWDAFGMRWDIFSCSIYVAPPLIESRQRIVTTTSETFISFTAQASIRIGFEPLAEFLVNDFLVRSETR